MKKTLVITTHHPIPETTGANMRTMHFVRFFAQLGSVDLAYTFPSGSSPEVASPFRSEVRLALRDGSGFAQQFMGGLLRRRPIPIYSYTAQSSDYLAQLVAREDYDYILVRSAYASGALFDLSPNVRARAILDLDDSVSDSLYEPFLTDVSGLRRMLLRLNRAVVRRHERSAAAAAAACLICNEKDRPRLTVGRGRPPVLVPNVFTPAVSERPACEDGGFFAEDRLLFVGTLSYAPNEAGLRWFLATVFGPFRRSFPGAALTVIGRSPSTELEILCRATDGVDLHADVDDVFGFYAASRAVVVPLLSGGGTRVKILESMFARRPVLSTAVGADGLDLRNGVEVLLFEDAAQFIEAYSQLRSESVYDALVTSAQSVLQEKYSVGVFDATMSSVLTRIG